MHFADLRTVAEMVDLVTPEEALARCAQRLQQD